MANNAIVSTDGELFLEVTDRARDIYSSKLFDLYEVWEKDGVTHKFLISNIKDLMRACDTDHAICIYGGRLDEDRLLITRVSWDMADKITKEGFVYVRYNDLRFCR